jgi:hypothetical protein
VAYFDVYPNNFIRRNNFTTKKTKMEDIKPKETGQMEEEGEDSEEWGEGYEDSDDDSSGGFDDDDDDSEGGFESGSDDDDNDNNGGLGDLDLKRVESKTMNKDYPYNILPMEKIKGIIASKLLEINTEFEYANLNDYIIWKTFKDNDFISKDAKN